MDPVPVDRLERDWRRELTSPILNDHLRRWRRVEPALRSVNSPAALLRSLAPETPPARKDAVLGALLRCAKEDPLAARVVLQTMLPALKRMSAGVLVDAGEQAELWSELLSHMWERIRRYPTDRRPRHIAANLRLDTLHDLTVQRRITQLDRAVLRPHPLEPPASRLARGDVQALIESAVAAKAISAWEGELILASRIDGEPLGRFAASQGVRLNTLVQRRRRAERRLFTHLGVGRVTWRGSNRLVDGARVAGGGPTEGPAGARRESETPRR